MKNNIEIVFSDGKQLDLFAVEFPIELSYSINDISDINKKKTTYSKSFNVPSTKKNNQLFKNVYDVNFYDNTFNINENIKCTLLVNKSVVLRGYLSLRKITTIYNDSKPYTVYNVNLFDDTQNLFAALGKKKLNELDFSTPFSFQGNNYAAGNHYYNEPTIENANSNDLTFNNTFTYAIVNYNYNRADKGANYPLGKFGITQFYPSIYVKTIIDKIFQDNGFTYTSDFFTGVSHDALINHLVTIYDGEKMLRDSILVSRVYENSIFVANLEKIQLKYIQSIDGKENYSDEYPSTVELQDTFYISGSGGYILQFDVSFESTDALEHKIVAIANGEEVGSIEIAASTTPQQLLLEINADSDIDIRLQYETEASNRVKIESNLLLLAYPENHEVPTGKISISAFLPDMSQSDFITSLADMFNLFIYSDKNKDNNLIIEPRDDFYHSFPLNWSDKYLENKVITTPLTKKVKHQYNFNMLDGGYLFNLEYNNDNNIKYGDYQRVLDGVLAGQQGVKTKFSSYSDYEKQGFKIARFNKYNWSGANTKSAIKPSIGFVSQHTLTNKKGFIDRDYQDKWNVISSIKDIGSKTYSINYDIKDVAQEIGQYNMFWRNDIDNIANPNNREYQMLFNLNTNDLVNIDLRNVITVKSQHYYLQSLVSDVVSPSNTKATLIKAFDFLPSNKSGTTPIYYDTLGAYGSFAAYSKAGARRPLVEHSMFDEASSKITTVTNNISIDYAKLVEDKGYLSNVPTYMWIAIPQWWFDDLKYVWYIEDDNEGAMSGAQNLGGNLFPQNENIIKGGVTYNVYITNYQTHPRVITFKKA